MAKRRRVGNMLALAVLGALRNQSMHPYELGQTLRSWEKDRQLPIKWGSLYTVVGNLERHGLIAAVESSRRGARPERTVYRITDDGAAELLDWVQELVSTPQAEKRPFTAGLSMLAVLPPDEARRLLAHRLELLDAEIASRRGELELHGVEVARLFLVEDEYELAMREAEVAWIRVLLDQMRSGAFPGLAGWAAWHGGGEAVE